MQIKSFGLSDVGRKREHNEDFFIEEKDLGIFIVCDGMGGHAAGEVASAMASEIFTREITLKHQELKALLDTEDPKDRKDAAMIVEKAIQMVCAQVYEMSSHDKSKAGMGTTLISLVVINNVAIMGHVGDSRLYLIRKDEVHQLSEDHSYCQEMIKRGRMSKEEAESSPYANVITRAIGIQESVEVDTLIIELIDQDRFVLCSDGFHGYLPNLDELKEDLYDEDLEISAKSMIEIANLRGGKDNVTVLIVDVLDEMQERSDDVSLKLNTLRKIPLFRYLDYQELVRVMNMTQIHHFNENEYLFKEGERGDDLYILLLGEVFILKEGALKPLAILGAGSHIGEMALVDQFPRSASALCKEQVKALSFSRNDFYTLVRQEPALSSKLLWSFLQTISQRLRDSNEQKSPTASIFNARENNN